MSTWQIAEAEAHFREVVERALREGPQTISDNGTEVVVVSADEYQAMAKAKPDSAKPDFVSFLLGGPLVDDFTIERDPDTGRDVEYHPMTRREVSFKAHLLGGPKVENFVIEREPDIGRDVDF